MAEIKQVRTRNYTAIIYEESALENWQEKLAELCVPAVISPRHDKDVDEDTGEPVKPHYHVGIFYPGPRAYSLALADFQDLYQVGKEIKKIEVIRAVSSFVRYLCHLDDKTGKKHRYDINEIVALGGADVGQLMSPTAAERYEHISEMLDFIKMQRVTELCDFLDYARLERSSDWFPLLCDSCTYIINSAIKSQRHKMQEPPSSSDSFGQPRQRPEI